MYVGAFGGYDWGGGSLKDPYCDGVTPGHCVNTNASDLINFGKPGTFGAETSMSSIVGGGLIGYNEQFANNLVFGAEMDLGTGGSTHGPFVYGANFGNTNPDPGSDAKIVLGLTGSARLRAGFAMDRFMPFVTGGVAFSTFGASYINPVEPGAPRSGNGNLIGWTLGAGVNYALTDNFILGAEYRYTNYGSNDLSLTNPALDSNSWNYRLSNFVTQDVRVSATYKF